MAKVSLRGIQATNMFFSSWALIFLTLGILREEWVELTLETKKNTISHSPWICCTTLWPEGILLLCALILYQLKLKQGQSVYYSTYKITWIIFTAYLSVSFFMASGILSLLECKKSTSACACATLIHTPERESEDIEESESSVKIVSLPENAAAPRSIVHTREGSPNRPQLQTRRVTWAL
ncbi:transmembrane protein 225 isoform X7 [Canis lupus familiaris]|uniref:transmembrane protein 225 isoform X7 n=1 Tax=Canis lupus familiaris TaxID=9615 RepID=UPI0018F7BE0A|nr:transmembrane protein 225 isoform X7 [Canis lupus familiaris]